MALLIISLLIPLILGFILLIPKIFDKWGGWITGVALSAVTTLLIIAAVPVWTNDAIINEVLFSFLGNQFEIALQLDNLSTIIVLLISVVGTVTAFYSIRYMKDAERKSLYFSLYNFFFVGMIGVVLSTNLLEFFFFWELMLIPSYLLIVFWGTKEKAAKIGLKYFFYTQIGSIGMLIAFAILGSRAGSWNISYIATAMKLGVVDISSGLLILTFVLLMIGLAVKLAIFPFQNWLPDAHGEAPTPISVLLSAVMIETAAYAIVRVGIQIYTNTPIVMAVRIVFEAIGAFTLFYGGFLALRQTDIKRLLAYSSISQMGYIFLGIGTYTQLGISGGLFHIVAHGFGKGILFMVAGILMHKVKTRDINEMGGLGRKMPLTAIIAFIGALNLAGTPPLSGFFSEWAIFNGALENGIGGQVEFIIVGVILLLGSILSAAYMLRFLWKVFLGPLPDNFKDIKETHFLYWIPAGILAVLAVFFGIFADFAFRLLQGVAI
jgi:NADH-quinone oxidoreductase subunit M